MGKPGGPGGSGRPLGLRDLLESLKDKRRTRKKVATIARVLWSEVALLVKRLSSSMVFIGNTDDE